MSLLIIGSCSKITQNIVLHLGKSQTYSRITISDLLPTYCFHKRYYKLRQQLDQANINTSVALNKLISTDELYKQINNHNDILFITHDYFQTVTSKTKIMELTAEFTKKKENVVFATPLEYDHFGFDNATQNYLNSQQKAIAANPNANFIRSDVQDRSELFAYLNKSKGIIEEQLISVPSSFKPSVVSTASYVQQVAQLLKSKSKGQILNISGESQVTPSSVVHDNDIEHWQTDHHQENIRQLVKKYKGSTVAASATAI